MINIGSPVASAVSGPGVAWTYASVFESGAHDSVRAVLVSALLLVPSTLAFHAGAEPSAALMNNPDLPPALPM